MIKKIMQEKDPEGVLKGRMAETPFEELLKRSKNKVYRFGYEAIIQNLTQTKGDFDRYTDAGGRIQTIPDFVVIDKAGSPLFVEVKFRWDGKLHDNDILRLKKIGNFWNAKIVFVNAKEKPFFRVSNPPYTDSAGKLICRPIADEKSWKIDPEVYKEFEKLVGKYLALPLK